MFMINLLSRVIELDKVFINGYKEDAYCIRDFPCHIITNKVHAFLAFCSKLPTDIKGT